mgnify:CR=1 FL=1
MRDPSVLGYFRLSRGTNGEQKERKSANIEVKNQKSAKMDEIHVT